MNGAGCSPSPWRCPVESGPRIKARRRWPPVAGVRAPSIRHRRHLTHQTALANARRPHHADHRAVAVDGALQQALSGGHFPPPTDQIRLRTPDSAMPFAYAQQAMGRDGLIGTLDAHHLRFT